MAVNDGDINDYIFNRKTSDKALPLIVIPQPVAPAPKVMALCTLIPKQETRNPCDVMPSYQRYPL